MIKGRLQPERPFFLYIDGEDRSSSWDAGKDHQAPAIGREGGRPMRRFFSTTLLGCVTAVAITTPGFGDNHQAAIALHIADPTTKNQCTLSINNSTIRTHDSRLSTADGPFFFTY